MELLERVVFGEEGVETSEKLDRSGGVEVDDGGEGEAQEEMVCCFATELPCVERGHAVEILLFEKVGLEPVDTAFMGFAQIVKRRNALVGELGDMMVHNAGLALLPHTSRARRTV